MAAETSDRHQVGALHHDVAKVIHMVLRSYRGIPLLNYEFVHFFNAGKVTDWRDVVLALKGQNVAMTEMRVTDNENISHESPRPPVRLALRQFVSEIGKCAKRRFFPQHFDQLS